MGTYNVRTRNGVSSGPQQIHILRYTREVMNYSQVNQLYPLDPSVNLEKTNDPYSDNTPGNQHILSKRMAQFNVEQRQVMYIYA
jgi:hypothetical protein